MKILNVLSIDEFRQICSQLGGIKRTEHSLDRIHREALADKIIAIIHVDKGHKNGPEYHVITENAGISIINSSSLKFITTLNARPGQLRRYKIDIPEDVMQKAYTNSKLGLNRV